MTAKLTFCSILFAAFAAVAIPSSPYIVSIQLDGTNIVVTAKVLSGIERVALESCRRNDLAGWVPRASQRVNGAGEIRFVVPASAVTEMEVFRVQGSQNDPLPASFYSGRTDFTGEWSNNEAATVNDSFNTGALSVFGGLSLPAAPAGIVDLGALDVAGQDHLTLSAAPEPGVNRVIPIDEWLVEFSGTELWVSPVAAPGAITRRYELEDLPVLGVALEGSKLHVLQGRGASEFNPIPYSWMYGEPDRGRVQHTVIETEDLPDLAVVGTATLETTCAGRLIDARPLWPEPGLLVWSVRRPQWRWDVVVPVRLGMPAMTISLAHPPLTFPGPNWPISLAPVSQVGPPYALLAVDVGGPESPRFLAETLIAHAASSDIYAANGRVFYSRSATETLIVSTNVTLRTNEVPIIVTNRVWQTNYISEPVVIMETNVQPTMSVSASKLRWPQPLGNSQFAGGWSHSLGLDGNGRVFAWGDNQSGAVGPGLSVVTEPTPLALAAGPVVRVAAGDWQSYAVDSDGVLWQWGNPDGPMPPLPGEAPREFTSPTAIRLPARVQEVSAGEYHTLAIGEDGRLWAWGRNYAGALGHTSNAGEEPGLVPGRFTTASAGWLHSLAVDTNGRVHSWGWNDYGQLGRGGSPEVPSRVELPEGIRFRAVAAGAVHSLALTEEGAVWAWGVTGGDPLGPLYTLETAPSPIIGLPAVRKLVCGLGHSLALAENGEVWVFGLDPGTGRDVFAQVAPLDNVVEIGAGAWHSFALTATGDLFIWGTDLQLIGGSGDPTQLSMVSPRPLIQPHTSYVVVTNIVEVERTEQQWQSVLVTNATPVYRVLTRHWLDVMDYIQDPSAPVLREPASLPGSLRGISHDGALLYTTSGEGELFDNPTSSVLQTTLSALAYDGIRAHFVDAGILDTSATRSAAQVAVHPTGWMVIARENPNSEVSQQLECWQLNGQGRLELLSRLERTSRSDALRLIDDLAVVRTPAGFEVVDLASPSAPVALTVEERSSRLAGDLNRVAGNRETGLWLPGGQSGTIQLWRE